MPRDHKGFWQDVERESRREERLDEIRAYTTNLEGTMGKNIDMQVKDGKLTLVIDMSKTQGPSSSGKSTIIATTGGNQVVGEVGGKPVYLGLNLYTK